MSGSAPDWIDYAVEKPSVKGPYEWRVPSASLPGEFVIVAAHMRVRGAGYEDDVLSPSFDYWDGYRVHVPKGIKWRETTEYKSIKSYERPVIGLEGLEHCECIYCRKKPRLRAAQTPSGGGIVVNPDPQHLNSWWLECCAWGRTPHLSDPREIERIRKNAMLRSDADMLTALQEVLATPGLQSGLQAMCAAAIAKATGRDVADVIKGV